jgi:hypothetical protein
VLRQKLEKSPQKTCAHRDCAWNWLQVSGMIWRGSAFGDLCRF